MDVCDSNWCNDNTLEEQHTHNALDTGSEVIMNNIPKTKANENSDKHSAVWTTNATSALLELYEIKLEMLKTPKKKTRIWVSIAESLRDYNIEMTPDQVRWKINALTKKYKQCVESGQHKKFKYYKEIDSIYAHYHVDCDSYTITELPHKKMLTLSGHIRTSQESKSMIELRKIRLANRIESDRTQGKLHLEKQWLEYLGRQEVQRQWRDEIFERNLKLREEELELRKRKLEFIETLERKTIQLIEKEQSEILQVESEKCQLLKQIFMNKINGL